MAQAIATMEGFYRPNSVSQRQNNPGNLRSWGRHPIVGGYVAFPTPKVGWSALKVQIEKNIQRGLTMDEFFAGKAGVYAGYAPGADQNDPKGYAAFVAKQCKVPALDVPLSRFL